MKYTIENLLALRSLVSSLKDKIKESTITEEGNLEFRVDSNIKGSQKKAVSSLLTMPLSEQYNTLLASELLAEGYSCMAMEGGWIVFSPKGEEYQLTENECTCSDYLYNTNKPCKHLGFRDWHLEYRARVNQLKIAKVNG